MCSASKSIATYFAVLTTVLLPFAAVKLVRHSHNVKHLELCILSCSYSLTHSHAHSLSLSLSPSHSHSLLTHTHTHTHTHIPTQVADQPLVKTFW